MRISDWDKQGFVLASGHCYVGGRSGETFIRDIRDVIDDRVHYIDYGLDDGASIGRGDCLGNTFILWASREATEEEIDRLHISDFQKRNDAEAGERLLAIAKSYAPVALRNPEVITDEMLMAEVARRELKG